MYLIYKILKEIRYIMRSKSMKRLITLVLIIILFTMLCSRVFAFETVVGTFEDYCFSDGLDTVNDIDDYEFVVLDLGHTVSSFNQRYEVYFYPKENCGENAFFVIRNDTVHSLYCYGISGVFTRYTGYYNGSDGNYVKSYNFPDTGTLTQDGSLRSMRNNGNYSVTVLYSTLDVITYQEYQYCNYSLSLSTEEQTDGSVFIYTNWLDWNKASYYDVYMEMYPNTANSINVVLNTERNIENTDEYRYYFEAEENGDYKFYFDYDDGDFALLKSQTITVSNIITNTGGGETGGGEQGQNGGGGSNTSGEDSVNTQDLSALQQSMNNTTTAINNQTQAITNEIGETNNFLQDTSVDDNQFNMPTVEVNDPTANFFDTMFTGIYNAVTTNEEKTITLPILNSNITVNSADFNVLQGNEWNLLKLILNAMWVVGIGLYILKDIRKMIDKIKDGNIENVANDDIKADIV